MSHGGGCCCLSPSHAVPVDPSCLVNWSAHSCASQARVMLLSQPRVTAKIAGKCPLVAMFRQLRGEGSSLWSLPAQPCLSWTLSTALQSEKEREMSR